MAETLTPNVQAKLELARLRRTLKSALSLAFDPLKPESRPTEVQQSVLADVDTLIFWLIGGNRSGKTNTGARILSWWFNDEHPYMDRPTEWGGGPLQMLVVGRVSEQIESEIWERKIKPFLHPGSFREVRVGGMLKRVINTKSGNRIIFLSHHDAEDAREKAQAFTSHIVWLDEMPDKASLITELVLRTVSNRGRMYSTFTPLIRNEQIKKIAETPTSTSRKVVLRMLDNPIYKGREAEVAEQVRAACASEAEYRARMFGEWYAGDGRVFSYNHGRNFIAMPRHYDPKAWRHLAVCDPAASGTAGLTVWAEDPESGEWFNALAKYLKGDAAFELLAEVERQVAPFGNLTRHCDCNPSGFYKEAARQGIPWRAYTKKNERKLETIENANTMFALQRVWFTEASILLEEETVGCMWSERDPTKIVNSSAKHLADTMRYAFDLMPKWQGVDATRPRSSTQLIRDQWQARKRKQTQAVQTRMRIAQRRSVWKRPSSSFAR